MDQNHSVFSVYLVLQFKSILGQAAMRTGTEVENIFGPPNLPKPIKWVRTEASDKEIHTTLK